MKASPGRCKLAPACFRRMFASCPAPVLNKHMHTYTHARTRSCKDGCLPDTLQQVRAVHVCVCAAALLPPNRLCCVTQQPPACLSSSHPLIPLTSAAHTRTCTCRGDNRLEGLREAVRRGRMLRCKYCGE